MRYARLGSSGLKVSRIALGMMSYGSQSERRWHLSQDEAEPIVRRAVEGGVTFFDTTRLRHLEDAIAAVDAPLSEDEVARLEAPYRPHPVLGHQ